jgi:putative tryptophan/tyrosine transport system substrate-binding protein
MTSAVANSIRVCRNAALILTGMLAFAFTAAEAQPGPKPARIALVCGARCEGGGYDAFRQGLRDLGRVEGRNLVVDVRGAEGHPDRLPALVAELIAGKPDLIVAVAPQPARAAREAAGPIPIVFVAVADPIAAGLVPSLARPGGTVTGLSTLVPGGFMGKSLQLLKEALPTGRNNLADLPHVTVVPGDGGEDDAGPADVILAGVGSGRWED